MTDVVQGRRERKKEETRRRITLAALELFHEKGFDATTVDEITERADVAKGTFFNYFPKKESVLEALSQEWMDRAEEHAVQHGRTASERILAVFGGVAESYGDDRALARMLVRVSMERMVCPEPDDSRTGMYQRVVSAIRDGQARGEFRPDLDPDAVFGVVASVFMGTLVWWVGGGPHHDHDPAQQAVPARRGRAAALARVRRHPSAGRCAPRSRTMRIAPIIVLALLPAALAAQQPASAPLRLTLDDAIRRALSSGNDVRIAEAGVRQAEGQVTQAWSTALPEIRASVIYTRTFASVFSSAGQMPTLAPFSPDTTAAAREPDPLPRAGVPELGHPGHRGALLEPAVRPAEHLRRRPSR